MPNINVALSFHATARGQRGDLLCHASPEVNEAPTHAFSNAGINILITDAMLIAELYELILTLMT